MGRVALRHGLARRRGPNGARQMGDDRARGGQASAPVLAARSSRTGLVPRPPFAAGPPTPFSCCTRAPSRRCRAPRCLVAARSSSVVGPEGGHRRRRGRSSCSSAGAVPVRLGRMSCVHRRQASPHWPCWRLARSLVTSGSALVVDTAALPRYHLYFCWRWCVQRSRRGGWWVVAYVLLALCVQRGKE